MPLLPPTFHAFHSNTTALPTEITSQILGYIVVDARPALLGGGVKNHVSHHPLASVSRAFRSIYLNHPYSTSTEGRKAERLRQSNSIMLEPPNSATCGLWGLFSKTILAETLQFYNTFSSSVSHTLTTIRPRAGASGLPIILTRSLSTFINTVVYANIVASNLPAVLTCDIFRRRPGNMEPFEDP